MAELTRDEVLDILSADRDLRGADLSGLDLSGVDFSARYGVGMARLRGADFSGCDLSGASFRHCTLWFCNFQRANLAEADLEGCIIRFCKFQGANLEGAHLKLIRGIKPLNLIRRTRGFAKRKRG